MRNKPVVIAVSGVKNSGKTTLITRLIPKLTECGYKVATIKHDGHDFDVKGTDSYRHKEAGAYGSAVFSNNKFMIVKDNKDTKEEELMRFFPEAHIILLEGFKNSDYPKVEIVRKGNSTKSVCKRESLLAIISDCDLDEKDIRIIELNDINSIAKFLIDYVEGIRG